jgi:hypothetical protein
MLHVLLIAALAAVTELSSGTDQTAHEHFAKQMLVCGYRHTFVGLMHGDSCISSKASQDSAVYFGAAAAATSQEFVAQESPKLKEQSQNEFIAEAKDSKAKNEPFDVYLARISKEDIQCSDELNKSPFVPSDPYTGSGGLFLGTPCQSDVDSGRIDFSVERFASFRIGSTTKAQVIAALGKPAGWLTQPDGTLMLEYDYVGPKELLGMRRVLHPSFTFNKENVLTRMDYPGSDSGGAK